MVPAVWWCQGEVAKLGRRLKGEGSVFQRKSDGYWCGTVTIGYDSDGRQVKRWVYGKTATEARRKLEDLQKRTGVRIAQAPERATVEEWLNRRIAELEGDRRPHTIANYRTYVAMLGPLIGGVKLRRLTALNVRGALGELARKGLSPSVRQHAYDFLRKSLEEAAELGLAEPGIMAVVPRPRGGRVREIRALDAGEVARFLRAARDDRLYSAFYLLLATGLRRGEMLGLRWRDIDDDRLHVRQQVVEIRGQLTFGPPKSGRSSRTLYLADDVRRVLEERRELQALERDIAKRWPDDDGDLVFTSTVGTPLHPRNLRRTYNRLRRAAGIPRATIHDLRRTWVTLARDAGLPLEVVADRAGHTPRMTAEIYSMVTDERRRKAAVELSELIGDDE